MTMRGVFRFVLAVLAGLVVGSLVNVGLIHLGMHLIPPPAGADTATVEGLRVALVLFEPRHFVFPFLAHALGTLAGAMVATLAMPGRAPAAAWTVGIAFLIGGIASVLMYSAPLWFSAIDLILAYLPAAWLGHRLVAGRSAQHPATTSPPPA